MYATRDEYKVMTGSTDSDARIDLALDISQGIIDSILENQEEGTIIKTVEYCDIRNYKFRSSVFNVQSITKIN